MKIIFAREPFQAAFQTAALVAPARSPKPILESVKFEVTDQGGVFLATDLEVGVRIGVEGLEVESAGDAVIPVDRMNPILRESSDEKLSLEVDATNVIVKGERSEFKLPGKDPQEFPAVTSFAETKYHTLTARLMKEMIKRTLFATDSESSRFALGGVLLELESDKIIAVGTDGRRLAKMEVPATSVEGHLSTGSTIIIPSKSLQLLDRALTDPDAEIKIACRANDVLVETPNASIQTRLVEGRFPRWRDVFPQARPDSQQIEITVGPFFTALRQAAIVTEKESRGIDFTFGGGMLQLTSSTAEVGQAHIELPVSYEGDEITLTMDHRYVSDFLKVMDADKSFTLEIEDGEKPALFSTEDGYGYVVMPLSREKRRN